MPKSENQKIKMVEIYDILRTQTDEGHPMSTKEILIQLHKKGISCERKSLSSDLAALKTFGYVQKKRKRQNLYYFIKQDLGIDAIRFLIDATQSAAFLSREQTEEIVGKLAALAGTNKSEVLKDNVLCFDKLKHSEGDVLETVTKLNSAIEDGRRVSFEYYYFGVSGRPEPKKRDGKNVVYKVIPITMVYHGGYYYLVAFREEERYISSFRIDRMRAVAFGKEMPLSDKYEERFREGDLKNSMSSFGMWVGEVETVGIAFQKEDVGDIIDKFGEGTQVTSLGEGRYSVRVKVNPDDPVFLGWCLSYGNKLEILDPPTLREKLKSYAEETLSLYKGQS